MLPAPPKNWVFQDGSLIDATTINVFLSQVFANFLKSVQNPDQHLKKTGHSSLKIQSWLLLLAPQPSHKDWLSSGDSRDETTAKNSRHSQSEHSLSQTERRTVLWLVHAFVAILWLQQPEQQQRSIEHSLHTTRLYVTPLKPAYNSNGAPKLEDSTVLNFCTGHSKNELCSSDVRIHHLVFLYFFNEFSFTFDIRIYFARFPFCEFERFWGDF